MAQMFSLPVLSARLIKYGLHDSAIAEYIFILPCPVFLKQPNDISPFKSYLPLQTML